MTNIVMARLKYRDPQSGKEFTVDRGWPCKNQLDAELIVKYYGMKTGALDAECKMEGVANEEIESSKTEIIAKEAHQA